MSTLSILGIATLFCLAMPSLLFTLKGKLHTSFVFIMFTYLACLMLSIANINEGKLVIGLIWFVNMLIWACCAYSVINKLNLEE